MREPPEELSPDQNARRAWQNGHEAAMKEISDLKISDLEGRLLMYFAIQHDEPLTPEQVKIVWDDALLTNVIVPILEHIIAHHEMMADEAGDEGEADFYKEQFYLTRVDHIAETILDLKEWRG